MHIITMKPTDPPSFEFVMTNLRALCEVIRVAVAEGTRHAQTYADWQDEQVDSALAPNLVRHKAKNVLLQRGQDVTEEDESPEFETEHISNNGLCLKTDGFQVRILKSHNGSIPPPGKSITRNNFYNQLQYPLFGESEDDVAGIKPTWGLVVHWFVDKDYTLKRLSLALPIRCYKDRDGRILVECVWDEPFWIKPTVEVSRINDAPRVDNRDIPIEVEPEEKTGEDPKNGDDR